MSTLSLAMIVRDAEPTLARVLESVSDLCAEMIVVDTGSRDRTVEIAIESGAQVHAFDWIDDFAAARNRSFELCTKEWILWLDADDLIAEESRKRLSKLKTDALNEAFDGVFMPYQYAFNARGKCILTLCRERLLRRSAGLKWKYPVHECIHVPPERAVFVHDVIVEHRPTSESRATKEHGRNLKILEKALSRGERNERNLFYYAQELRDHGRSEEAIMAYRDFLECSGRSPERYWAVRRIASCYGVMEQHDLALKWGLLAIEMDAERAEAYNDVGMIHYRQNRIREAIPFFSAASAVQKPQNGFFVEDCHYQWLPYDYLSTCYMSMGDYEKALECGLKAAPDHPDIERVEKNNQFLMKLIEGREPRLHYA